MKKFQTLVITHPHEELVSLLSSLKEVKGIFSYKKNKSVEYARNIFHKEETVACFTTDRKSLAKSSVWIVISKDEMTVTNITPGEMQSLGISLYNIVLNTFYYDFVEKYIDVTWTDSVRITKEDISINEILSPRTYQALVKWERCCNHTSPITNESDQNLWFDFIRLLHNEENTLSLDDFSQWLMEDMGWSSALEDIISDLESKLEYSLDLLNHYDANNTTI